jgi:phosphopantothenoylcysteine decarboxylase/phosphopantothenate--cysteine ligase
MTPSAHDFITPLTLSTLSKKPVLTETFHRQDGSWNNHVEIGTWADALLIVPATANTMAKMASGQCDNLLLTVYLSARCPVFLAPAMDVDMLQHPGTRANIDRLKSYGHHIINPGHGELASGLVGEGRMAEPEEILNELTKFFAGTLRFKGKSVLVTAGPTYEAIDPVRFIGNHSSGKMGFAIAEALAKDGAEVHLVCGPTQQQIDHPAIKVTPVTTAEEMHRISTSLFPSMDLAVLAAAVSDYKPVKKAIQKIKKNSDELTLSLTKTQDIAASLGKLKHSGQVIIGFALETEDEESNAIKKMKSKNFDLIILNSLKDKGAGFGHDTNKIKIINKQHKVRSFALKDKHAVAKDIVDAIAALK